MSGFTHLELNKDNVLISSDNQALLCDFSGLNSTGVTLQRLIAPLKYRAPEFYDEFSSKNLVVSQRDTWLYDLTAFYILTKVWADRRMGKVTDA